MVQLDGWGATLRDITKTVTTTAGNSPFTRGLEARLSKLRLFDTSAAIQESRYIEQEPGEFGTLLIELPVVGGHTGGELHIKHGGTHASWEAALSSTTTSSSGGNAGVANLKYAAFSVAYNQRVSPVQSGLRVLLEYRLVSTEPGILGMATGMAQLRRLLSSSSPDLETAAVVLDSLLRTVEGPCDSTTITCQQAAGLFKVLASAEARKFPAELRTKAAVGLVRALCRTANSWQLQRWAAALEAAATDLADPAFDAALLAFVSACAVSNLGLCNKTIRSLTERLRSRAFGALMYAVLAPSAFAQLDMWDMRTLVELVLGQEPVLGPKPATGQEQCPKPYAQALARAIVGRGNHYLDALLQHANTRKSILTEPAFEGVLLGFIRSQATLRTELCVDLVTSSALPERLHEATFQALMTSVLKPDAFALLKPNALLKLAALVLRPEQRFRASAGAFVDAVLARSKDLKHYIYHVLQPRLELLAACVQDAVVKRAIEEGQPQALRLVAGRLVLEYWGPEGQPDVRSDTAPLGSTDTLVTAEDVRHARILELAGQQLSALNAATAKGKPQLVWEQPHARLPELPEVEAFLRVPKQSATFFVPGAPNARKFAGNLVYCKAWQDERRLSASTDVQGRGSNARVVVTKGTALYDKEVAAWEAKLAQAAAIRCLIRAAKAPPLPPQQAVAAQAAASPTAAIQRSPQQPAAQSVAAPAPAATAGPQRSPQQPAEQAAAAPAAPAIAGPQPSPQQADAQPKLTHSATAGAQAGAVVQAPEPQQATPQVSAAPTSEARVLAPTQPVAAGPAGANAPGPASSSGAAVTAAVAARAQSTPVTGVKRPASAAWPDPSSGALGSKRDAAPAPAAEPLAIQPSPPPSMVQHGTPAAAGGGAGPAPAGTPQLSLQQRHQELLLQAQRQQQRLLMQAEQWRQQELMLLEALSLGTGGEARSGSGLTGPEAAPQLTAGPGLGAAPEHSPEQQQQALFAQAQQRQRQLLLPQAS